MKKYLDLLTLVPIGIVTMVFIAEKELGLHAKNTCIGLLAYLFVFSIVYFMLLHMKVNKWVAIAIALVLWIIITSLRKKYM
jgi:accessory gene regulator protein AgrB